MTSLSVVTTLYNSEPFIVEFYERIIATAEPLFSDIELIFVDDGSPDDSNRIAQNLAREDPRAKVVELSRNFGHHKAMFAGLENAVNDYIFLIDVDLEEPPELLGDFMEKLQETEADVVFGVQNKRGGTWFKRFSGALFYKMFNAFSDTSIPENLCTIRLMNRHYVESLLDLRDTNLFLGGNLAWIGFRQVAFPFERSNRRTPSNYTLRRMFSLAIDAISSFSSYPLHLIFYIGMSISIVSGIAGTFLLAQKLLIPGQILSGWSSLMLSIWFLGGVIISFLGIIGIYISKVFDQTKGRPVYLVRAIHQFPAEEDSETEMTSNQGEAP